MRLGIFRGLKDRIDRLMGRGVVDEELFDELEAALIGADVPVLTAHSILEELRDRSRKERIEQPAPLRQVLQEAIAARLKSAEAPLAKSEIGPTVYLFLGVNGAGKTTTIAKVARLLKRKGNTVLLAAADTFRAAAIEQLSIWADRVGVEVVRGMPGGDPGAVVFDAITAAKARGIDYVLADTAGRQHTKFSLMAELEKVARVSEKALGRKPDEILLVLDGNTGQNAIRQAEEFSKAVGVTGVVMTKLDGSPRGGSLLGVQERLGIPIKLIGVGEQPDDLYTFDASDFAKEMLSA